MAYITSYMVLMGPINDDYENRWLYHNHYRTNAITCLQSIKPLTNTGSNGVNNCVQIPESQIDQIYVWYVIVFGNCF